MIAKAKKREYSHIPTDQPFVALTFDDGPDSTLVPLYLDLLKKEGVKATFYVIGNNVSQHPEITRRILAEGHELGNHTMTHNRLPEAENIDVVSEEIVGTQEVIEKVTGVKPSTFRAPYMARDEKVWAVTGELGLFSINASRLTDDSKKNQKVEAILEKATVETEAGDVILMHSWSQQSLDALPEIIARLRAKGLQMVTVSEMLETMKPED